MASALDLAGVLRALDSEALAARLAYRTLTRASSIHDAFDLADALVDPHSVKDALAHLDRGALVTLQVARIAASRQSLVESLVPVFTESSLASGRAVADAVTRSLDLLAERFLVVETPSTHTKTHTETHTTPPTVTTLTAVGEQLDDEPSLSRDVLTGSRPPVVLEAVADTDRDAVDARAAERLFSVVIEVAEIIRAVESSAARELAKGGLALPETRRLADAARIDVDDVAPLLRLISRAGLVELTADGWTPSVAAADWLAADWSTRWAALTDAWITDLSPEVRVVLEQRVDTSWGAPLREFGIWFYPAGGSWITERIDAFALAAETLGLTSDATPTSVAVALLRDGTEAARAIVDRLLPDAIEHVYLQHDLSVVAPGPLAASVDTRLRVIADVESAGLAATYRISETGVRRALNAGESEETLRAFLEGISLTGIPQPLDYLLTETAARHGRYRVSTLGVKDDVPPAILAFGAVTQVRSDEPALVDTLEVDQALAPLGLRRIDSLRMVSRFDVETLYWALDDEKYPVVLEDDESRPQHSPNRRRTRRPVAVPPRDAVAEIVERLRLPEGEEAEETERAWIARQLDAAVKARMTVTITVAQADGGTSQLSLEPTGVGGGRVRGRDRKSDIERTLPLSSVVAVSTGPLPA